MALGKIAVSFAGFVFISACAFGQSLGDVARTERQKQADSSTNQTTKVITNDDLNPSATPAKPTAPAKKSPGYNSKSAQDEAVFERNAEKTKAAILAQETRIKQLQAEIQKLRSSIRYIETGVPANDNQLQKQQAADRMQERLNDENKKLEAMQEAARRAGYGNVVYEP